MVAHQVDHLGRPFDRELVTAGTYELAADSWDEIVDPGELNPHTGQYSRVPEYRRHLKGDLVSLDVHEARRLLRCGSVVVPGVGEQAEFEAAERALQQAQAVRDAAAARTAADAADRRARELEATAEQSTEPAGTPA